MNLKNCLFVTDLHGDEKKYEKLFNIIVSECFQFVFIGGDILPNMMHFRNTENDFFSDFLLPEFGSLKSQLKSNYPKIFIIMGNDDPKIEESNLIEGEQQGLWYYIHDKMITVDECKVLGYSYVPPTPFQLKDWEKYDVSRYIDPGCVSPEEGSRSVKIPTNIIKYGSIKKDLDQLAQKHDFKDTVILFHSPPYKSNLDRAALDGKMIDHVPLDVHVGSIAIKEFIESTQPMLTLHGHIHESTKLTGKWKEKIGSTYAFNGADDSEKLAIIRFSLNNIEDADRELI